MPLMEGVRVVELGGGIAASYATKLFADFGADVIKVEPPEGDVTRRHAPYVGGVADPERSATFLHLNTNKRSIVVDLSTQAGRATAGALAASADIVVESFPPGTLAGWGLGFDTLVRARPRAVLVSVTPYGQTGPYAGYPGDDLSAYAAGPLNCTGGPDREPVRLGGSMALYQTGNTAATAALAALMVAQAPDGQPVHVDVNANEVHASYTDRRAPFLVNYAYRHVNSGRADLLGSTLPNGIYPTADGYVQAVVAPAWVPRMLATINSPELNELFARVAADPALLGSPQTKEIIDGVFYGWLLERTKQQAMEEAEAHKWPVTALNTPVEVLTDRHFQQRGFFVDVEHPVAGRVTHPGAPVRMEDGWAIRRPAPLLGQHTDEVLAELAAASPAVAAVPGGPGGAPSPAQSTPATTRLPLEGVRVLDMTVVWSGPTVTMLLSDLGAEVIRVDNPWMFPSSTKGVVARPTPAQLPSMGFMGAAYPDGDPGLRPWNRHAMYVWHARGKRMMTLDLRQPSGRDIFLRLAETADVFVENNSVSVLGNLGIDWDTLHARNPRLILLRMPPLGVDGPYSGYLGLGAHFEAVAGVTAVRGYRNSDPTTTTSVFQMDPVAGSTGTWAVMAALRRRERTGQGELIELPQVENEMNHLGEIFIDAAANGNPNPPLGNRNLNRAPQGLYPTIGPDEWLTISVGDDAEWARLVEVIGRPAWATDPRLATFAGRVAAHDEIDAGLAAWTSQLGCYEAFHALASHGVTASPVWAEAEAFHDPHLRARGFFRSLTNPEIGTYDFPGHQWTWTGPALRWEPVHPMGADNDYVYKDLLGVSDEEYVKLEADGHIARDYFGPDGQPL